MRAVRRRGPRADERQRGRTRQRADVAPSPQTDGCVHAQVIERARPDLLARHEEPRSRAASGCQDTVEVAVAGQPSGARSTDILLGHAGATGEARCALAHDTLQRLGGTVARDQRTGRPVARLDERRPGGCGVRGACLVVGEPVTDQSAKGRAGGTGVRHEAHEPTPFLRYSARPMSAARNRS